MALLKTLKPMLSSAAIAVFVILAMTNKAYSQSNRTYFTYDFDGCPPKSLTYQGDAFFPSDSPFLRLTATNATGFPQQNSIGRVLRTKPIVFRAEGAVASFETTINFTISGVDNIPADGLVFFMGPVGSTIPVDSGGGDFGVYNISGYAPNVFAVEFDVYVNGWDPEYRHIGINFESRISRNNMSFEGTIGQAVTACINYDAVAKVVTVNATAEAGSFEVSTGYDLSTLLPEQVQVGLAASTGMDVAVHDVASWYFISTLEPVVNQDAKISQF